MSPNTMSLVAENLGFCDCLRWHDGELWFSDFLHRRVMAIDENGGLTERAYVPGQPAGIGFLPDGTPLVLSSMDHLILALKDGHPRIVADLAEMGIGPGNDMLIDAHGRAYFGCFGFHAAYEDPRAAKPSALFLLGSDGTCRTVADGLMFPNGMALSEDGGTLVVAETFANRLTAFTVATDGSLGEQRLFADLGDRAPDGICMDASGAIWVACPFSAEVVRVVEGGAILETVATSGRWAVGVALGGNDGHRLFVATATTTLEHYHQGRATAAIEAVRVAIPATKAAS